MGTFICIHHGYKDHRADQNTKGKLDNHTGYIQTNSNSRTVAAHNLNKVILIQSNHCMAIFCHNILTDDSKNLHILVTKACESQDIN